MKKFRVSLLHNESGDWFYFSLYTAATTESEILRGYAQDLHNRQYFYIGNRMFNKDHWSCIKVEEEVDYD